MTHYAYEVIISGVEVPPEGLTTVIHRALREAGIQAAVSTTDIGTHTTTKE